MLDNKSLKENPCLTGGIILCSPASFPVLRMKKNIIVLATHNKDKAEELLAVLSELPIRLKTLKDFPAIGDIPETGETLLENSMLKARTVHQITGLPAIADDTGLEVDALDGAPGIYAARFAGEHVTYQDNVNKLLHELRGVKPDQCTACFRTVMSYVDDSRELWSEGKIQGVIIKEPRGESGFGYDPVFYVPNTGKTFAEMTATEKNSISHRARAMQALKKKLETIIVQKKEKL